MKLGIIRERKTPPDSRVPLNPAQCKAILSKYPQLELVIEASPSRCYTDAEYQAAGIQLSSDLSDCDVLMGVKEVPVENLIADKTYFFFSHTIKKQVYNRKLLQAVLQKNIQLLDYEVITNAQGQRVIAFGRFAGIAGAHNGLMTYGRRTKAFELPQMKDFKDFAAAIEFYKSVQWPAMKIVLTGAGRVANGAAEVLDFAGIQKVSPNDFLTKTYTKAVYTQLDCQDYVQPKEQGVAFDLQDFFKNPTKYQSSFAAFTKVADLMINGIFWDNKAPAFFTAEEMAEPDFNIQVIADITCDIAPVSSIPSTLFASTIADPIFGYDPKLKKAVAPFQESVIDMMTIDNLPNELPRDASTAFGEQFIEHVLEELLGLKNTGMVERATIAANGQLGTYFQYLEDYVQASVDLVID